MFIKPDPMLNRALRLAVTCSLLLPSWLWTLACSDCGGAKKSQPTIGFASPAQSQAENAGTVKLSVVLDGSSSDEISLLFTLGGSAISPDDYTITQSPLILLAGQKNAEITINLQDDRLVEGEENLVVRLEKPANAELGEYQSHTVTILDNDTAPTLGIVDAVGNEAGGNLMFEVSLSPPNDLPVSVDFTTGSGTASADIDYESSSGTLVFNPGDTRQPITVAILDDRLDETDEVFFIYLSNPVGASIDPARASGSITDDDPQPTVEFQADGQNQAEDVPTIDIRIVLSSASGLEVTVPFGVSAISTATQPDDYRLPPSPATIPAGSQGIVLPLTLVDDALNEADETMVVELGTPTNARLGSLTSHTVTILDNDAIPLFEVLSAETMDADQDGKIDHYRLTFSKAVLDSTFPGQVEDQLGAPQVDWQVAGHGNLVLAHGLAAPEADTRDDQVLYLTFAQGSTSDTDSTPDITTSAAPGLRAQDGGALGQLGSADLEELDRAAPVMVQATTETGSWELYLFFSEPVHGGAGCPGSVSVSDLVYLDNSLDDVGGLVAASDPDGCDGRVVMQSAAMPFSDRDMFTDQVQAAGSRIFDLAGNESPPTPRTITGIIHPYVLQVVSVDPVGLRVEYSEGVDEMAALDLANYRYTNQTCADTPNLSGGIKIDQAVYAFTTSAQFSSCIYQLEVTGDVRDLDENATLTDPKFGTFVGNELLRVVGANARSLRTFVVRFSKDVLPSGPGGADNPASYTIPVALGTVSHAERYDRVTGHATDANQVLVTHTLDQGWAFYSVIVSTALLTAGGEENLAANPFDRTTFLGLGGEVTSIEQGPLFTDPFGDGTSFSFVFSHGGKIYAGPNDNNDAVFRFDPDGRNAVTVTFQNSSGKPGGPFPSFGNSITRPAHTVENPYGTVTRYHLTPDTDLSAYATGDNLLVRNCTYPVENNKSGIALTVDDAGDFVDIDNGTAGVPDITCEVTLYNSAGPADFDGVDAFVSATVSGESYLVFGTHYFGGGVGRFREIYFTQDIDTVLDNQYCDIFDITLGNTQSLQTIYGYGDRLYIGFGSDVARRPILASLDLSRSGGICNRLSDQVIAEPGGMARRIDYLGGNGAHPNLAPFVGIDSLVAFDDESGAGTALYIANNGGIAATTRLPLSASTTWTVLRHDGDGLWEGTTQPIPHIGKLRPGQKGVPVMTQWDGYLFVARNRSDVAAAEVWKYHYASGWSKVVDSSSTVNGMNPNNARVSVVAVSGERLYIGFDNPVDGAELWRTTTGVTAVTFSDHNQLEKVGLSGFGPAGAPDVTKNKYLISNAAIFFNGKDYLYLTIGCDTDFTDNGACDRDPAPGATDFAIRLFRQVD